MDESPAIRRRGPKGGDAAVRDLLLAAAREEFATKGYRAATVRAIAATAGVDPMMITHYFGSKERRFHAASALDIDATAVLLSMTEGPRELLGERIVRRFFELYDDPTFRASILALVRSALTDPDLTDAVRSMIINRLAPSLATHARGNDPQRQVMLAMTQLLGVVIGRHVIGLPPLAADIDDLVAELAPTVQRYFDGTHAAPPG
jgi:AcrR family transcriptional regulator